MLGTKPIVSIENVVATGYVNQRIDLASILDKFPDSDKKENFPGLIFKIDSPRTTTLIFSSGKMVCTGAKSEANAQSALKSVVRALESKGIIKKSKPEITVQNIVASVSLGARIRLEFAARSMARSMYEPEQFPGLIHRMVDPKAVVLIFASGKMVCAGTKKEADTYRAVNNMHALLAEKKLMA